MASNLPPGVNEGMIPGNRPEDIAWEKFHDTIDTDATGYGLSVTEAALAWQVGLAALELVRTYDTAEAAQRKLEDAMEPQPQPQPEDLTVTECEALAQLTAEWQRNPGFQPSVMRSLIDKGRIEDMWNPIGAGVKVRLYRLKQEENHG